ncbi:hypothetical protein PAXRUDRAFT_833822 [Paxillus rubicundulus Ve08.2h10]|uniref:Secreted protein n=1 Tax=Paxillus rubicundulus Ve08.2h10 TaxID=930991 RepID=A0A0D0DN73_9AGAM|nr:hypothetical protein PAXRUDRAFT_833822 [Paxillus rubicundulus Ve08.2h10]
MQFLTLLVSIASLYAYTLVCVHAQPGCTNCPAEVDGLKLYQACLRSRSTHCTYGLVHLKWIYCHYDEQGTLIATSEGTSCPSPMSLASGCKACTTPGPP